MLLLHTYAKAVQPSAQARCCALWRRTTEGSVTDKIHAALTENWTTSFKEVLCVK